MESLHRSDFKKYFFWLFVALLLFLSYLMLKPYLATLVSAFILSFLVRPVYNYLEGKIGKSASALVCILLVICLVVLPFSFVVGGIINQAKGYAETNSLKDFANFFFSLPLVENLGIEFESLDFIIKQSLGFLVSLLQPLLSHIISFFIALFILFIGMYYILVDWDLLGAKLKHYIPFKEKEIISREISEVTKNIVYGTFLVGLIEFAVAGAGFFIFGVDAYLLLSSIIFFSAFIPGIGPGIIWVPTVIFYLMSGNIGTAIGVLIVGLIISVGIDTLLRGKIVGKKTKINSFVMLLGIFGGVAVFGLFGFIIGPLILVYTLRLLEEGLKEKV